MFSISKPSYSASQYQPCSSSTQDTLFIASFAVSSATTVPHLIHNPSYYMSSSLVEVNLWIFYVIIVVVLGCIMYGLVLTRLRDASDSLPLLKLTKVCACLGLFGSSFTSEIAYIVALFVNNTSGLKGLAGVVLIARFFHLPVGCYVITKLMGSSVNNRYLQLADKEHLLINRSVYTPLFLMILLDNTNVAFLPWLSTKFSSLSDGYPDMRLYKMCVYVKILQSFIVVIIQIAVLGKIQSSGFFKLSLDTQAFLCISLSSSIVSLVVIMTGVTLLKSLTNIDVDTKQIGTNTDNY